MVFLYIEIPKILAILGRIQFRGRVLMKSMLAEKFLPKCKLLEFHHWSFQVMAIMSFLFAAYIAIRYANQVPLDLHSFRQTQTALTAFWFTKNSFKLAYETPVAGPPWSIPFEFPLYQYLVAHAAKFSGISLGIVGRITSFIFLVMCLVPIRFIIRDLKLPGTVFYIFMALFLSSPLYLYWSRTFMIETAAIFFAVAAIRYFVCIIQKNCSRINVILYIVFIILSILQKATTGLPVLAVLCLVYIMFIAKRIKSSVHFNFVQEAIPVIIYFFLPLIVGIAWTLYTDHVKGLNGIGVNLVSSALKQWNWGTIDQRFSLAFYDDLLSSRIFLQNLSGPLGVVIIIGSLVARGRVQVKSIVVISLLFGLTPLFLFTNLHIVHDYYPVSNVIFLIFAVAVPMGSILISRMGKWVCFVICLVMVGNNYLNFAKKYYDPITDVYSKKNSGEYAVADFLKREVPAGKSFVAFGNDWSSSLSYLSERKSFTVPTFFKKYNDISLHPEHFIPENNLGAIVLCPSVKKPTIGDLMAWSTDHRTWKIGEVHGCYVALPEMLPANTKNISQAQCQGSIDRAGEVQIENSRFLAVNGWSAINGEKGIIPDKIFITIQKDNNEPLFAETLKVTRADVNANFGQPDNIDLGFSRILNVDSLNGRYKLGLARLNKGHLESCQLQKEIFINSKLSNE